MKANVSKSIKKSSLENVLKSSDNFKSKKIYKIQSKTALSIKTHEHKMVEKMLTRKIIHDIDPYVRILFN